MIIDRIKAHRWRRQMKSCAATVSFGKPSLIMGEENISIGEGTRFNDGLWLYARADINIGQNCQFGALNNITCANNIVIGNGFLSGKWVTISDNSHGGTDMASLSKMPAAREICSKGPIIIEDNVWVGDKATILGGVRIGQGAVIGANAVVTKDIPAFCVAVGNPARIIDKSRK